MVVGFTTTCAIRAYPENKPPQTKDKAFRNYGL
jgi:hypothetical protein